MVNRKNQIWFRNPSYGPNDIIFDTLEPNYGIDVDLKRYGATKSELLDILFGVRKSHGASLDILFKELGIHTIDSIDVVLKKFKVTKSASTDVLFKELNLKKSDTIDTLLKKLDLLEPSSLDVILARLRHLEYDLWFDTSGPYSSFDIIFDTLEPNYGIDVELKKYGLSTSDLLDVLFFKRNNQKSSADILFEKLGITKSNDIDVLIKSLEIARTIETDVIFKLLRVTRADLIDVLIKKYGVSKIDNIDVIFKEFKITNTDLIDVIIRKYGISKDKIDTLLKKPKITKTDLIDVMFDKFLHPFSNYSLDTVFQFPLPVFETQYVGDTSQIMEIHDQIILCPIVPNHNGYLETIQIDVPLFNCHGTYILGIYSGSLSNLTLLGQTKCSFYGNIGWQGAHIPDIYLLKDVTYYLALMVYSDAYGPVYSSGLDSSQYCYSISWVDNSFPDTISNPNGPSQSCPNMAIRILLP